MGGPVAATGAMVAATFKAESPRALATLIRVLGDMDLAEDAVQDAFVTALERWPRDGLPASPGAWITTTARNRAYDRLRREAKRGTKQEAAHRSLAQAWEPAAAAGGSVIIDDRLRLVFTCCHPVLALDARVALALRTLCGLTTAEVARAFSVPEATMAQRLVRAKRRITEAGVPYRVPSDAELPERLGAVLNVVNTVFTAGLSTPGDDLVRVELCREGLRLGRLLVELMPDEPEAAGLLALMLLSEARRPARLDADGEVVVLADQVRGRWDGALVEEGVALVEAALRRGRPGPWQLQAAIAACHTSAASVADTDWDDVLGLYDALVALDPTPVARLNRAVALAEVRGPLAGLEAAAAIEGLERHHLWHAVRADLLRRLGRPDAEVAALGEALGCCPSEPERRLLARRLDAAIARAGRDAGGPVGPEAG